MLVLEFIAIYYLAGRNSREVQKKGREGWNFGVLTAVLWLAAEFLAAVMGVTVLKVNSMIEIYACGLVGAVLGGLVATIVAEAVSPKAAGWSKTHSIPAGGLPTWASPDGTVPPVAILPTGLELTLKSSEGDWALVQAANGWTGWVDGRALVRE